MALVPGSPLPFGLYEVMLIPFDPAGADETTPEADPADWTNVGYARSVAFTIDGTSVQTEGNDQVLATETFDEKGTGTIEQAGMNLHSTAFIWGQTAATDGATPDQITTVTRDVSVARPHFQLRSRSRSSKGGTFETNLLNAQANGGPNMTQGYGVFGNAQIPFSFTPNADQELIQVAEYETAPVDVAPPPPGP